MERNQDFKPVKPKDQTGETPPADKIVHFLKPQGEPPPVEDTNLPAKVAEEYMKKHGSAPRTRFDDPFWRRLTRGLRSFLGQK